MKQQIKQLAGSVLHHLAPGLGREVDAGRLDGPNGKLKQLIVDYRTARAAASGDVKTLRDHLALYWQSPCGDEFYDAYPERFENWFLGHHYSVIEALAKELDKRPGIHRLIEVGCGDGKVLHHLSERFPQLTSVTGIDLNRNIIARNREVYKDTRMQFESADLNQWLQTCQGSGILLASYGGVLEYLTQSELEELFTSFREVASPVMLVLVEPIASDFDLDIETASRSHGIEHSFSHPHRHLLEKAGWTIHYEEVQNLEHRWMLMLASA